MGKFEELEFEIKGIKPVSTNEMYSYGKKKVRKSNKYKAFETEVFIQMREKIPDLENNEKIKKFKERLKDYKLAIKGYFKFYIPKRSYFRADTSNFIKPVEDIVKNLIGIDDSRNVKIEADKYLSDKEWNIEIRFEIYELEYEIPENKWSKDILGIKVKKGKTKKIKSRIEPIKRKKRREEGIGFTDRLAIEKIKTVEIEKGIEQILLI